MGGDAQMSFSLRFTKQAEKDLTKIASSTLKNKAARLLRVLTEDPYQPPYEKLVDLTDTYSRRINVQHRLVYRIYPEEKIIVVIQMWTHYGDN